MNNPKFTNKAAPAKSFLAGAFILIAMLFTYKKTTYVFAVKYTQSYLYTTINVHSAHCIFCTSTLSTTPVQKHTVPADRITQHSIHLLSLSRNEPHLNHIPSLSTITWSQNRALCISFPRHRLKLRIYFMLHYPARTLAHQVQKLIHFL